MWIRGSIELPPRAARRLIVAGLAGALLWPAFGAPAGALPAGDRDLGPYLRGLVAPAPVRAAPGLADLAGRDPAGGDGPAETPPIWEEIPPVVRLGHSAVFDPGQGRMVVFGGMDGEDFSNKTWLFMPGPAPRWELLAPRVPDPVDYTLGDSLRRPSPRTGQATVLVRHQGRDRLLVIGGFDVRGPRRDVWALDLAERDEQWTKLALGDAVPDSLLPRPRSGHTAIYDEESGRVIVFGGLADSLDVLDDVWELDLEATPARWTKLDASGPDRPGARVGHTAVYDPIGERMLVFGGLDDGFKLRNDAWELPIAKGPGAPRWKPIEPRAARESPPPRARHAAAFDAKHDRMLIFAGVGDGTQLDDLWELSFRSGPEWRPIPPVGDRPSARMGPAAVIDASHGRLLVFGGLRRGSDLNDTWALSLLGQGTPKWTLLSPPEGEPGARLGHAAAYDPARDRMLMVGGSDGGEPLIDVWALDMGADGGGGMRPEPAGAAPPPEPMSWRQLRVQGEAPPGRSGHTAVYDPDGDRLLVFGGLNAVYLDDLWALALGEAPGRQRWTRLLPGGDPPGGRANHTAVYDTRRKRIVVFGGVGVMGQTNDTWVLSLGEALAWTPIGAGGLPGPCPVGRSSHVAVYDSLYDRMVVWGGITSDGSPPDAWELRFGSGAETGGGEPGPPTWRPLATRGPEPPWQFGQSAVIDVLGNRMLLFGGGFQSGKGLEFGNQVYELTLRDTCTWRLVAPTGDWPRTRVWHSAIYDPGRNRMVLYGGGRIGGLWSYRADLWTLTWGAADTQGPAVEAGLPGGSGAGESGIPGPVLALASPRPNPAHGEVAVVFTLPGNEMARIEIVDVRGRRVQARDLGSLGPGSHTVRIAERGGLAAGVYFVRLHYGARTLTGKLAVLR